MRDIVFDDYRVSSFVKGKALCDVLQCEVIEDTLCRFVWLGLTRS